jgi:hypothetical protein
VQAIKWHGGASIRSKSMRLFFLKIIILYRAIGIIGMDESNKRIVCYSSNRFPGLMPSLRYNNL